MLTPSQVRLLAGSPAHHPRLSTDSLFLPPPGSFQYTGPLDEAIRFIQEHQLLDAELWSGSSARKPTKIWAGAASTGAS